MDEYINKKAFLESQIKRCKHFPPLVGTCAMDNVTLENEIMKFPVADVEPVKHGYWIINSDGYYPQCSECLKEPKGREMTECCPHCGAKMDGGKENG